MSRKWADSEILQYLEQSFIDISDNDSGSDDEVDHVVYDDVIDSDDTDADPHYNPKTDQKLSDVSSSDVEEPVPPAKKKKMNTDKVSPVAFHSHAAAQPSTSGASTTQPVDAATTLQHGVPSNTEGRPTTVDPHLLVCDKVSLRGKNGHRWTNKPTAVGSRSSVARNIIHITPGCSDIAKNKLIPVEVFSLFLTNEIKNKIVYYTNLKIQEKSANYKAQTKTVGVVSDAEFDALLGLLILSAAQRDNHLPSNEMFNPEISGERYHATMSCDRFDFLLECLRFDDSNTRADRRKTDHFAPMREVWDLFIAECRSSYKPGSFLTIDEQLLAFRGRCNFRMYIPNKPDKYGLKLVLMCDNATKYMVDAIPYTGRTLDTEDLPQAEFFVKKLSTTCHGSNRNITVDNWFTSVPLATSLLEDPYKLTIVGTLRKDKREIPPEMKNPKGRAIGTSMFCFDGPKTMVSYKVKNSKVVLLLSTCHEKPVIHQVSKKPQIIETYNATKGAVDTLDQMCHQMSCSRKTRRWPLCVFYGMLNIILVNAYVIYVTNLVKMGQKPVSRRKFAMQIHHSLIEPWLQQRIQYPTLTRTLRQSIADILKVPVPGRAHALPQNLPRTICGICPSVKRRMTTVYCTRCNKPICAEHRGKCCVSCVENF